MCADNNINNKLYISNQTYSNLIWNIFLLSAYTKHNYGNKKSENKMFERQSWKNYKEIIQFFVYCLLRLYLFINKPHILVSNTLVFIWRRSSSFQLNRWIMFKVMWNDVLISVIIISLTLIFMVSCFFFHIYIPNNGWTTDIFYLI